MHRYESIIYWSDDDGAIVAEVPELPGCAAHGSSPKVALVNCPAAIALWLDTAKAASRLIPVAKGRRLRLA
jgi:predicted RNase H-like HicB family nuclease